MPAAAAAVVVVAAVVVAAAVVAAAVAAVVVAVVAAAAAAEAAAVAAEVAALVVAVVEAEAASADPTHSAADWIGATHHRNLRPASAPRAQTLRQEVLPVGCSPHINACPRRLFRISDRRKRYWKRAL
jgi:hypothetical protein